MEAIDRLLRLIAQETFRLHNPDDGSSPWADEWRDEGGRVGRIQP